MRDEIITHQSEGMAYMNQIAFVRHGQIAANRKGKWHGSTDSSLTFKGNVQALKTAIHLSKINDIAAIYCSPLKRCKRTAQYIGTRLGLEIQIEDDLREYGIGDWEGTPFLELQEKHNFIEKVIRDPDFSPPNGESLNDVNRRFSSLLHAIRRKHSEKILIVSHGAAIAVALAHMLDQTPTAWMKYHISNCSITELNFLQKPFLTKYNNTAHLNRGLFS